MSTEITLRQVDNNEFVMEAKWLDTENIGTLRFQADPSKVTISDLFRFANQVREAGEKAKEEDKENQ
jgi:hypothetical protein